MKRLSYILVAVTAVVAMLIFGAKVSKSSGDERVDFMPGSCPNTLNISQKGVFHVALAGPVSSTDLNTSTVRLNSIQVSPISSSRLDQSRFYVSFPSNDCSTCNGGPDGTTDLILKFDTQTVVSALGLGSSTPDCIQICLETNLGAGCDYVRILRNRKP